MKSILPQPVETDERLRSGHTACPGCGVAMAMRLVLKAMDQKTILVLIPGCAAVISATYPFSSVGVPAFHSAFEIAAPTAAGIAAALKLQGRDDITVVAFAGDGGTFDIGLQSLSGACDRNDDFMYVCFDNEAYMNTGIQSSSATPEGAWTMTTPGGRPRRKKHMMEIIAAHRIPYAATANVGFPQDLMEKVRRARTIQGTRFLHLFTPCPTGWRMEEDQTGQVAMLAVETKLFPLYEIYDGTQYRITHEPQGLPIAEYFKPQGRYRQMQLEHVAMIQQDVDQEWARLRLRATTTATSGCVSEARRSQ